MKNWEKYITEKKGHINKNSKWINKKRKWLKVQSSKLYNKIMVASTQITNTEIFAFIAVLIFKLLSRKVLFINRKDNRNC